MAASVPQTGQAGPDESEAAAPAAREAYRRTAEEVVAALGSDAERGLSDEEARRRLARYGPNELQRAAAAPAWRRFLAQFQNVLVLLLLAA
ncbi:MAG: cation-transporting P-type ATPase, partial [Chloroflexota bacterium]